MLDTSIKSNETKILDRLSQKIAFRCIYSNLTFLISRRLGFTINHNEIEYSFSFHNLIIFETLRSVSELFLRRMSMAMDKLFKKIRCLSLHGLIVISNQTYSNDSDWR